MSAGLPSPGDWDAAVQPRAVQQVPDHVATTGVDPGTLWAPTRWPGSDPAMPTGAALATQSAGFLQLPSLAGCRGARVRQPCASALLPFPCIVQRMTELGAMARAALPCASAGSLPKLAKRQQATSWLLPSTYPAISPVQLARELTLAP